MYKIIEKIFSPIIRLLALCSVLILFLIIAFILKESLVIFKEVPILQFLLGRSWRPVSNTPTFSILPIILASMYVSVTAIVIALPIGIGCAMFISFFIGDVSREVLKSIINILAGIPSVVYGLIGLLVIVKYFEVRFSLVAGESVLAGGILLAIMILPYIINTCSESMIEIKKKYMATSDVLGVSKLYMISHLVLPAVSKAIIASTVLALGRAMGETMAVMMVIGNAPIMPKLLGKAQTIPSLIALEMGAAYVGSLHYHGLFAAGFVLMILLLLINIILYYIRRNISY
ncbi:MAG: phosphate ABC transporter permease subunit PstC [Clostridiaceae bacterium]|nr:phosphate ABC transporter permease subunit PstC [Clostridiaceae bacterium]